MSFEIEITAYWKGTQDDPIPFSSNGKSANSVSIGIKGVDYSSPDWNQGLRWTNSSKTQVPSQPIAAGGSSASASFTPINWEDHPMAQLKKMVWLMTYKGETKEAVVWWVQKPPTLRLQSPTFTEKVFFREGVGYATPGQLSEGLSKGLITTTGTWIFKRNISTLTQGELESRLADHQPTPEPEPEPTPEPPAPEPEPIPDIEPRGNWVIPTQEDTDIYLTNITDQEQVIRFWFVRRDGTVVDGHPTELTLGPFESVKTGVYGFSDLGSVWIGGRVVISANTKVSKPVLGVK